MTPPESSWGPGASTSPAKSSAAKAPHGSPKKKKNAKKPPSKATTTGAERAPREPDFTASETASPADGERITVHAGRITIEGAKPAPTSTRPGSANTAVPAESTEESAVELAAPAKTEPQTVVGTPPITKPRYVPRTVRPTATSVAEPRDIGATPAAAVGERVPDATPAPFPRRPGTAERLANRSTRVRTRVREWMTDRRAIVISLVPVVAIVGLVAGAALYTTLSDRPATRVASALSPSDAAAQGWIAGNLEPGQPVLVDAALVPGLVDAGWTADDVLTAGDAAAAPWREIAYVASSAAAGDATTAAAVLNSVPVAVFGDVQIRRVVPEGIVLATAFEQSAAATRREFGAEISRNPAVEMSTPDRVAFAGGTVDARVSAVLGALAAVGVVTVTDLPVIAGEEAGVVRQVALARVGDVPLVRGDEPSAQAQAIFDSLSGDYALDALTVDGADLVLRFASSSETPPE